MTQLNHELNMQLDDLDGMIQKTKKMKLNNKNNLAYDIAALIFYAGILVMQFKMNYYPATLAFLVIPRLIYFILRMIQISAIDQYNQQIIALSNEGKKLKKKINMAAKGTLNIENGKIVQVMNIPEEVNRFRNKVHNFKAEAPNNEKSGLNWTRFISIVCMAVYIWFVTRDYVNTMIIYLLGNYGSFPIYCYGALLGLWCLGAEWTAVFEKDDSNTGILNLLIGTIGGFLVTGLSLLAFEIAKAVIPWITAIFLILVVISCF